MINLTSKTSKRSVQCVPGYEKWRIFRDENFKPVFLFEKSADFESVKNSNKNHKILRKFKSNKNQSDSITNDQNEITFDSQNERK